MEDAARSGERQSKDEIGADDRSGFEGGAVEKGETAESAGAGQENPTSSPMGTPIQERQEGRGLRVVAGKNARKRLSVEKTTMMTPTTISTAPWWPT